MDIIQIQMIKQVVSQKGKNLIKIEYKQQPNLLTFSCLSSKSLCFIIYIYFAFIKFYFHMFSPILRQSNLDDLPKIVQSKRSDGNAKCIEFEVECILFSRLSFNNQSIIRSSLPMRNEQSWEEGQLKKNNQSLPQLLAQNKQKVDSRALLQVEFNPKDPHQQFYKETLVFVPNETAIVKIGWKIANLQKSEQDLALKCFHLLPIQLLFPINIYTNLIQYDEKKSHCKRSIKCLWMQQTIHTFIQSKDLTYQSNNVTKTRIFQFAQSVLLPKVKSFMANYLSWDAQNKNEYDEQTILKLFHSKVIEEGNVWIREVTNGDKP